MTQLFSNNAGSTLASGLGMSDASMAVAAGHGSRFQSPTGGDFELLTIHDSIWSKWEVVKVTARSGDVSTIVRGYEGTQQIWQSGDIVSAQITAKTLQDIVDAIEALQP